jgi:C_GCAxxG_C_C family probable redox protein
MNAEVTDTNQIIRRVHDRAFEYEQKYGSCPQCVLGAIQDELGIITDDVFRAAYALGGGVGLSTEGTCGALTGGVIALGCKYGRSRQNFAKGRFLKSYEYAKKLHDRFLQEYGSTICRDVHKRLFGRTFNLWDSKEYEEFEKAGAHRDKCPMVVGNVAKWVAETLKEP